jgi:phage terminase large subunit-like protein
LKEAMSRPPVCGRTFRGVTCRERGDHYCGPRVAYVVGFFRQLLVHTKGRWAKQPFELAEWQRDDIIGPLFGQVAWNAEAQCYARSYRLGWIELARKNGKSELLAGCALYLLVADGEEGAEIYGCARDRDQARKVFDVAARMVTLSPNLSKRLRVMPSSKRIVYERTGSYYEIVAADAAGNMGHNPSGVILDECHTQPDGRLWDAMRTGMGTRVQPLMIAATTAGNDRDSFAGLEHAENLRIAADPDRAPHRFVYIRNTPEAADPWDEAQWTHANPALGEFLSIDALRQEAIEARNDPAKENVYRQMRLNQWVSQATRWVSLERYDACCGDIALTPQWMDGRFDGRTAWCGLDLSARHDLTAWCTLLPPTDDDPVAHALWRCWIPEDTLDELDNATAGQARQWARAGWLTVTDGTVIHYERVYADILADAERFTIAEISYDKWSGEPVRQAIESKVGAPMVANEPSYSGMTTPLTELMSLTLSRGWAHHGNPIARWAFDAVEVRHASGNPDLIRPVKPARDATGKRIDPVIATALAVGGWKSRGQRPARKPRIVVAF